MNPSSLILITLLCCSLELGISLLIGPPLNDRPGRFLKQTCRSVHSSVVSPLSPGLPSQNFSKGRGKKNPDHSTSEDSLTNIFKQLHSKEIQKGLLRIESSTSDGERGLYLNEFVEKDTAILMIPMTSCLTDRDPPTWFSKNSDKQVANSPSSWATRLAAALIDIQLRVKKNGDIEKDQSLWLSLLPEPESLRASLPVHWPEKTLQNARSTALEIAADSAFFARGEAVGDLLFALEKYPLADGLDKEELTTICHDALDIVQTRSCRLENSMNGATIGPPHRVIAPGFDFINHGSTACRGEAGANVELGLEGDVPDELNIVIRATKDLRKDTELLIDYGDSARPAWKCLLNYGFVPHYQRIPSPGDESASEEEDDNENLAEVYMEGKRYDVGPYSIPSEMVEMSEMKNIRNGDMEIELTGDIAVRLARRISDVAYLLLLEPEEDLYDDHPAVSPTKFQVISNRLAASLRWSQHRILLACAAGLRQFAAEESSYL